MIKELAFAVVACSEDLYYRLVVSFESPTLVYKQPVFWQSKNDSYVRNQNWSHRLWAINFLTSPCLILIEILSMSDPKSGRLLCLFDHVQLQWFPLKEKAVAKTEKTTSESLMRVEVVLI